MITVAYTLGYKHKEFGMCELTDIFVFHRFMKNFYPMVLAEAGWTVFQSANTCGYWAGRYPALEERYFWAYENFQDAHVRAAFMSGFHEAEADG